MSFKHGSVHSPVQRQRAIFYCLGDQDSYRHWARYNWLSVPYFANFNLPWDSRDISVSTSWLCLPKVKLFVIQYLAQEMSDWTSSKVNSTILNESDNCIIMFSVILKTFKRRQCAITRSFPPISPILWTEFVYTMACQNGGSKNVVNRVSMWGGLIEKPRGKRVGMHV